MTREDFERWVRTLEQQARERPSSYRFRVAALAATGYVFAVLLLLVVLGIAAGIIAIIAAAGLHVGITILAVLAMLLPMGGILVVIVRAMRVKIPTPEGVRLDPARMPSLFAEVETLRRHIGAPRVHAILVDPGFCASLAQVPRLGLFGCYRNILTIGLPLMQSLSPEQFSAVLAHELAHLAGRHASFSAWIYRIKRTWSQLMGAFESQRQFGTGLLRCFMNWYVPVFDAYTFILRRDQEYEADRLSAQMVSPGHAAEALMNTEIAAAFLDRQFWPEVLKLAGETPTPPAGVFAMMARMLPKAGVSPDAAKWLRQALLVETDFGDTHPCLADRLGALGHLAKAQSALEVAWQTAPPQPLRTTAAEHHFGPCLESLLNLLERGWRSQVLHLWSQRHQDLSEARRRLDALGRKAQYDILTECEQLDQCVLTRRLCGNAQALPLLQDLLKIHPRHPKLRFLLGAILLEEGDSSGIDPIEFAMQRDLEMVYEGCELIYVHLTQVGRLQEALRYLRRAEQHYASLRAAERERDGLNASDIFKPHDLSGDLVCHLRERIGEVPEVAAAYLVQKALRHFPNRPMYVLAVEPRRIPWYDRWHRENVFESLSRKIGSFPHPLLIVRIDRLPVNLPAAIRTIPAGQIHPRVR